MEDDKKVQDNRIHKLEHQLHTAHASVHCLRQRLSRSNKMVEVTSLENTDVNSQLREMESEFRLLRRSLHDMSVTYSQNACMTFRWALYAQKKDKSLLIVYVSVALNFSL